MITENAVCLINDDDTALYPPRRRIETAIQAKGLPYSGAPGIVHSTLVRFLNPVSVDQRTAIWELFKEFETEEFYITNYVLAHLTTFGRFNSRTASRIINAG